MVRLYVGGLPADVTAEQLAERFAPFGRVEGADLAAPQADGCAALKGASCRGFGYVELEPKDEAALRRCLSTVGKRRLYYYVDIVEAAGADAASTGACVSITRTGLSLLYSGVPCTFSARFS